MNDNTKVLDQNPGSVAPVDPVHPQGPVGVANKEMGRVAAPVSEFLRPSGAEISPSLSQEEKESGVQVKSDKPDLTFEHKELGVDHAGPDVPVPPGPTGLVQISEKKDTNNSSTWLNTLLGKVRKIGKLMGI